MSWNNTVWYGDNNLVVWGDSKFGQIVSAEFEDKIVEVKAMSESFLAVVGDNLFGWGWNEHGNLGLGHKIN